MEAGLKLYRLVSFTKAPRLICTGAGRLFKGAAAIRSQF